MSYSKLIESERYFLISEKSGIAGLEIKTFVSGR
jgi:hypothetical protein